mgnify:CR=1 FL=1
MFFKVIKELMEFKDHLERKVQKEIKGPKENKETKGFKETKEQKA